MLDAAALAAILDPERKVPGWWTPCWTSPDFGGTPVDELPAVCKFNDWYFVGPENLHTAREHCWRKEEWLVNRGYQITIFKVTAVQLRTKTSIHDPISRNKDHAAALNAAIERISNEKSS